MGYTIYEIHDLNIFMSEPSSVRQGIDEYVQSLGATIKNKHEFIFKSNMDNNSEVHSCLRQISFKIQSASEYIFKEKTYDHFTDLTTDQYSMY